MSLTQGGSPGPAASDEGLLTVRGMDSAALVFITAPAVHEHQATIIQTRLIALADRTRGRIALSLADVIDMTSAGINALVTVNTKCKDLGGALALFGLSREIRKMLRVTRLDRAVIIAETAHEAVKSLDRPRRGFWGAFSWARSDKDAA